MKVPCYIVILIILLGTKSLAQCGEEYPNAMYHNTLLVTMKGDTVNNLDKSGYYEGLHYYTDNEESNFSDSTYFVSGQYHHGIPIGNWVDHCKDSSYSIGEFSCSEEVTTDKNGHFVEKKEGIYNKIGVWKYYSKTGRLLKTERYDRQTYKTGWEDKKYLADSSGRFVLVSQKSAYRYSTIFRSETTKTYSPTGIPISVKYNNFWHSKSLQYYAIGQIRTVTFQNKFLGRHLNITIEKEYNDKDQLKCKTITCCPHPGSPYQNIDYM